MTINQLYKKYKEMGTKFDTVYISQITNDLYQAKRELKKHLTQLTK